MSAPLAYLLSQKPPSKVKPIHLDHPRMVMGRNMKADIPVFSVNVSREHALITQDDKGNWAIEDLKSLNGVFVNEIQVPKGNKKIMVEGDVISLGPPELTKFSYTFHFAEAPKRSPNSIIPECTSLPNVSIPCEPLPDQEEESGNPSRDTSHSSSNEGSFTRDKLQEADELIRQLSDSILTNIEKHLSHSPTQGPARETSSIESHGFAPSPSHPIPHPLPTLPASSTSHSSSTFTLNEPGSEHSLSLLAGQDSKPLPAIAIDVPEVAEEVQIDGTSLPSNAASENPVPIQSHLMEEGDINPKEGLWPLPSSSEQIPPQQNAATSLPAEDLEEIEKKAAFKGESIAMEKVGTVMENEFTCAICTELFVQATTLNCSHTFCKFCIEQWLKTKKECPICRARITARTHSLVLDNFINKMTESLSEEAKLHRQELVTDRQKSNAQKSPTKSRAHGKRVHGESRYNTRGNPNDDRATTSEVVDISSDSDMSIDLESDDYSDSEYFENYGRHNAYYGGYGHCFNCGRSGHWRSGCPYLYM